MTTAPIILGPGAVPEPSGVLRDAVELTNDARLDIPSTLICTGYSSKEYKEAMDEATPGSPASRR